MKVILLEKFKNLGEVGELVEVKPGYARNFLVPNQKALFATKKNQADFETRKAQLVELSKKRESEATKIAEKIKNQILPVVKQAGDDGRLFGAVNSSDVSNELNKVSSVAIDRKQVTISTAIKFIGFYQVYIDLGEGVTAQVYVNVARSESEAEEQKTKFLSGKLKLGSASTSNVVNEPVQKVAAKEEAKESTTEATTEEVKPEEQAA